MTSKTANDDKGGTGSRVTLRTIAEVTGLSLSTVSLSLRGGTTLKQETRDKVAEAAKALGYVPDRAGVRLRTGKTNVIVLVMDGTEDSIDFARQMIQGIGQGIKGTRYHLTVTPEFEPKSTDTIRYILDNRTADGIIITHTTPRDRRVQLMIDRGFPFVSHGRTEFFTPHPYHDLRSEVMATMAVERMAAKGCRKILMISGDDQTTNYHTVTTSFHRTAARAGLVAEELPIEYGRSPADLRRVGLSLAQSEDRPDAIFCDSEMRAIALLGGLQAGGVVPGRDIEMVYKQISGVLPALAPDLDSLREDVFGAGVELTRLLLRRIAGAPAEDLQTLADPIPSWSLPGLA